jgi:hypothetical protein
MLPRIQFLLAICLLLPIYVSGFHDCIEASASIRRQRRVRNHQDQPISDSSPASSCAGGICIGMVHGPHEGGNASYPVAWNGKAGTTVHARMTVPGLPAKNDGITYYIWTDVFFGDASLGRMNQFVPQLMFGNVLDESSGPPNYRPKFHDHNETWVFGAHYYFQTYSFLKNASESHAAYGPLFPTWPGESLYTSFEMKPTASAPQWILTMGVVGDESRVSELIIQQPYMGIGRDWDEPTTSWLEPSYKNMCINACWELYGSKDVSHLPSTGSHYEVSIVQPNPGSYVFTRWERDEGNGQCPSASIAESHTDGEQFIDIDIAVSLSSFISKG